MKNVTLFLAAMALLAVPALAGSELIYEVKPLTKDADAPKKDTPDREGVTEADGTAKAAPTETAKGEDGAGGAAATKMSIVGSGPNACIHDPTEQSRIVINGNVIYVEDLEGKTVTKVDQAMIDQVKKMRGAMGGAGGAGGGAGAMPGVPPEALKRIEDAIQQLKDKRAQLKPNEQAAKPYLDQQIKALEDTLKRMGGGKAAGGAAKPAGKRLVKTGRRDGIKLEWLYMDGEEVLQKIHVVAPGNLDIEMDLVDALKRFANMMEGMSGGTWVGAVLEAGYIPHTIWDYKEGEISTLVVNRTRDVKDAEVKPTPGLTPEDPFGK